MGSGGKGATGHVAGELFQMMAGVKFQHVPYRGEAPAMTDLIGGQVQLVFATTGSSLQYVKAGQMRRARCHHRRHAPSTCPTCRRSPTPCRATRQARGAASCVPRNTSTEIIDTLNEELNAAAADPAVQARFAGLGAPPFVGSPADFGRIIAADVEKWGKVIKASGLTGD